jgi:hypothetical protein
MKISEVTAENRKKAFMIRTAKAEYLFPYTKLRVAPSVDDPIEEVFADAELGKEAFCSEPRFLMQVASSNRT